MSQVHIERPRLRPGFSFKDYFSDYESTEAWCEEKGTPQRYGPKVRIRCTVGEVVKNAAIAEIGNTT